MVTACGTAKDGPRCQRWHCKNVPAPISARLAKNLRFKRGKKSESNFLTITTLRNWIEVHANRSARLRFGKGLNVLDQLTREIAVLTERPDSLEFEKIPHR